MSSNQLNTEIEWFYMSGPETRSGPVHKTFLPDDENVYVWCPGMKDWQKRGDVMELKGVKHIDLPERFQKTEKEYYYQSKENKSCEGPVNRWTLVNLFTAEQIDRKTLIWTAGEQEWKEISDFKEFKDLGIKKLENDKKNTSKMKKSSKYKKDDNIWYYSDNYRVKRGPVSYEKLEELVRNVQVQMLTLCWKKGMKDWKEMRKVRELKPLFGLTEENDSQEIMDPSVKAAVEKVEEIAGVSGASVDENIKKRKRKQEKANKRKKWKNITKHANVYVTGLPEDVTEDELIKYFSKCGIIKKDVISGIPKVKIYKDESGKPKGDGLITYFKEDSVPLAVEMLDDSDFRPNCKIKVEKAQFEMKGDTFIAKENEKEGDTAKKLTARRIAKTKDQNKDLDWNDDIDESEEINKAGLKIVILKPMFTLEDVQESGNSRRFYDDLTEEVGFECQKVGGPIEKLTVFEGSESGAIAVKFKTPASAAKCIEVMNNRYFGGQCINCDYFDGTTDYRARVKESSEEEQKRLDDFGNWLENN